MSPRIIFMGTPYSAVPTLNKLNQKYNIVSVVTQPDRPKGRGRKLAPPPVKVFAEDMGIPVLQPPTLCQPDVVAQLQALNPDIIIVVAYGQILKKNILAMPKLGCLNIHASLLPRWRGAAPILAAIRAGDAETGVTIMKMARGLDTGAILRKRAISITVNDTRQSLTETLAHLGADLLIDTLLDWIEQNITLEPQDDTLATLAPRVEKKDGLIDWQQSAIEIDRHVRAFYPWPGTFGYWHDKLIKIISVSPVHDWQGDMSVGQVFKLGKKIAVATGKGTMILNQIQPAGKRAMPATDFARGSTDFVGGVFGS